jgi:hypothetical protein
MVQLPLKINFSDFLNRSYINIIVQGSIEPVTPAPVVEEVEVLLLTTIDLYPSLAIYYAG